MQSNSFLDLIALLSLSVVTVYVHVAVYAPVLSIRPLFIVFILLYDCCLLCGCTVLTAAVWVAVQLAFYLTHYAVYCTAAPAVLYLISAVYPSYRFAVYLTCCLSHSLLACLLTVGMAVLGLLLSQLVSVLLVLNIPLLVEAWLNLLGDFAL